MPSQPEPGGKKRRWRLSKPQQSTCGRTGTILHAVPKPAGQTSQLAPLSPLEMAMATSPNEEILNSIARSSHTDAMQCQALPQFYSFTDDNQTASIKVDERRTQSEEKAAIIGYWKGGETHWEGGSSASPAPHADAALSPEATTEPAVSVDQNQEPRKSPRPRIQVVIPDHWRPKSFHGVPFFAALPHRKFSRKTPSCGVVPPPSAVEEEDLDQDPKLPPQPTRAPVLQLPEEVISPQPLCRAEHPSNAAVHQPAPKPTSRPSVSSSSSSSYADYDDGTPSNYSRRTSVTSVQDELTLDTAHPKPIRPECGQRKNSAFSILNPVAAGVFGEYSPVLSRTTREKGASTVGSPLDDLPIPSPPRELPSPSELEAAFARVQISSISAASSAKSIKRRSASAGSRSFQSRLATPNHATSSKNASKRIPSPTLSETEAELERHLATIAEGSTPIPDGTHEHTHQIESDVPPPIPRKNSARRAKSDMYVSSNPVLHTPTTPVARSTIARALSLRPSMKGKAPSAAPNPSTSRSSTFPIQGQYLRGTTAASDADVSPGGAETVILKVFEALDDFDDLFATAIVNKEFYSVFKRHELSLMRKVLHAMSPSAWEHRETCPPWTFEPGTEYDGPKPEYIPETYLECYVRDSCTINALQSLIHERCQSILRPKTAAALVSTDPQESSYVNDALWRIWTFCEIFGCGKGREDDIVGQMDWLKGGELVHQQSCRATIMSSDSFGLSSVLMCAPDYFAKGNAGGLTAEQLYDMTELWNCLGVLIQGIYGRAVEARQYGVFDRTDIEGGDIDGEEAMLEEWCSYLLTHGLSTILDLAAASTHQDPTVFTLAASKGYMTWTPPPPGASRSTFLKDALSRVYEDKIAAAFAQSTRRQQARESSLRRSAEIAKRRERGASYQGGASSAERPFSEWDLVMNSLDSARRGPPLMSRAFAQPTAPPPTLNQYENVHPALPPTQHPPTQHPSVQHYPAPAPPPPPRPLSTYTPSNPHVLEEPVSQQHPRQSQIYNGDPAVNSADRAIFRIVEMGFTAEQARRALRVTDLGDGLRVDRAVELLLRA